MLCKGIVYPLTKEMREALNKVNELAKPQDKDWRADLYLQAFLEAVQIGAIQELKIDGTTFEVYADTVETE